MEWKGKKEFLERSIARASTLALSASARTLAHRLKANPFSVRNGNPQIHRCDCARCLAKGSLRSAKITLDYVSCTCNACVTSCSIVCTVSPTMAKERESERIFSRYQDYYPRDPGLRLKRMIIYSAGTRFTRARLSQSGYSGCVTVHSVERYTWWRNIDTHTEDMWSTLEILVHIGIGLCKCNVYIWIVKTSILYDAIRFM